MNTALCQLQQVCLSSVLFCSVLFCSVLLLCCSFVVCIGISFYIQNYKKFFPDFIFLNHFLFFNFFSLFLRHIASMVVVVMVFSHFLFLFFLWFFFIFFFFLVWNMHFKWNINICFPVVYFTLIEERRVAKTIKWKWKPFYMCCGVTACGKIFIEFCF